ncbi:SNF2 family domain-containing protein [Colletotrichum camelliae]|nr:SNF2 family domain-containing protein [Colletotrichum camelliae]
MKRTLPTEDSSEIFSSKRPWQSMGYQTVGLAPSASNHLFRPPAFPIYDQDQTAFYQSVSAAAVESTLAAAIYGPSPAWPSMLLSPQHGFSFSGVATPTIFPTELTSSFPWPCPESQSVPYVDNVQGIGIPGDTQTFASVQDFGHDLQLPGGEAIQPLNCEGAEISKEDRAETPNKLKCDLRSHQKVALAWMKRQEQSNPKGGLLADDMGLGKTISVLALLVATRKTDGPKQTTLVVAPLTLMPQWCSQIREKAPSLSVHQYHKSAQKTSAEGLMNFDVVLTTYETVVQDWKRRDQLEGKLYHLFHPQHSWHRVVLDESHEIKNRKTKAFSAVCDIPSQHRWCLSGTPMMNGVDELLAQFAFLRTNPQDDLKQISRTFDAFERKKKITTRAMNDLRELLQRTMLRRTKRSMIDGKAIIQLPLKTEENVWIDLKPVERKAYDAVKAGFDPTCLDSGLKAKSTRGRSRLEDLIRLRQHCCHPSLSSTSKATTATSSQASGDRRPAQDDSATVKERCGPDTRSEALKDLAQVQQPSAGPAELGSAKIEKCIELIKEIQASGEKTIVFSEWITLLWLLVDAMDSVMSEVKHRLLTGKMSTTERQEAVSDFMEDPEVKVMMISLFAGSVGLNLTAASRVIIMEPSWNPYVQMQAVDRAHRMGQKRPVKVYRILARDTIEGQVIETQEKKREMVDAIFGEGTVADVTEPFLAS